MSGSNSSNLGYDTAAAPGGEVGALPQPVSLSVHSLPSPVLPDPRLRNGRLKMLLVLLVCAAPVIASYVTYYVIRPQGGTNYGQLVDPQRPLPSATDLPLTDLQGASVDPASLKRQWLLLVIGGGACDAVCEQQLYVQRQLREALGKEKDRVDRVWIVDDAVPVRADLLPALKGAVVLRAPREALARWLDPANQAGVATDAAALEARFFLVDPLGNYMMRFPAAGDPARVKRDLDKLLRASAGWDEPGR